MDLTKKLMARLESLPDTLDVNVVLGNPQTVGDTTIVPVTEMMVAFGMAGDPASETACCDGHEDDCCGGVDCGTRGGGHAHSRPLATIEVGPEETRVHPIVDSQRVALAGMLLSIWIFGWIGLLLNELLGQERS